MRTLSSSILMAVTASLLTSPAARGDIPWKTPRVTVQATQQRTVADVIQELVSKQGLQAVISPQVRAVVSGDFQAVPCGLLLNTLCDVGGASWFYDGGKIYVDAEDEVATKTLVVNALTRKSLEDALRSVGFSSGPAGKESHVKGADTPGLLLLAGGPRYIQATELVAKELDVQMAQKFEQSGMEYVVRTYRLKYATAQDANVGSGSGASVMIPGVATTLQRLLNPQSGGSSINGPIYNERLRSRDSLRGTGLASFGQNAPSTPGLNSSGPRGTGTRSDAASPSNPAEIGQPVVVVDTRLNAIVIRDLAARMPLYDELIQMLDVPTQAIEITAAVVDVDATNNKDFGMEFLGNYTAKDGNQYRFGFEADRGAFEGGQAPSTTIPSFVDGTNIARGDGLNVAALIGGQGFDLLTRLRALQQKGTADIVSSPSVLTMENVEAVIRSNETFYVRVAGEQEVDLFDVTAGVQFRVTPSVITNNGQHTFKLMLDITDGSFQDATVDQVPGTRESAITTQAMVPESKTLLVGGYFLERKTDNSRQVPILGDIPIVGLAFKRKEVVRERKQRFFFITPKLVDINNDSTPAVRDDVHPATIRAREVANEAWKATIPNPNVTDLPPPIDGAVSTDHGPGGASPSSTYSPKNVVPRIHINPQ
ncbi:MAG: type III secretion system outer membrane ring subunit SctC [Verrucomicrobium sp.]|nr:type III secretion system outer membrane ring subunit SctC [Verrucomicrobium sp.]